MENKLDCYNLFSLYHNEMFDNSRFGFRKLNNGKNIIWINDQIYLLKDLLEGEKELIEFNSNINLINILDDFTFFVSINKDSFIIYFNNDYSINKKMNLLKAELLLILDISTIIVLDKNNNNDMEKLIIMKKEEGKYRHFIHAIDNFDISNTLFYKICKLNNKKFLFYYEENGNIIYNIYSYDFQKRKFNIIKKEYYEENKGKFISIFPINDKYIIKFIYLHELILELFDIELFQKIYSYHTNLKFDNITKNSFVIFNDINEIPIYHLFKFLGLEKFQKFEKKASEMKKFKKIILREEETMNKFYVFYVYQNSKIYMENYEICFDKICDIKLKLADDEFNCWRIEEYRPITFINLLYNEKQNTILIDEKQDYFVFGLEHVDDYLHWCFQIILFSKYDFIYEIVNNINI